MADDFQGNPARAWSEAEISTAMRAGYDRSVPLEHRPATSPKVQGVVLAESGRPTERSVAQVSEFEPGDPVPANSSVIRRSSDVVAQIPVERVYLPEKDSEVQDQVVERAGYQEVRTSLPKVANQADGTMAARPEPADATTAVGVMQPEIEQSAAPRKVAITTPGSEHGVGVQTTPRQTTDLSTISPINVQGADQKVRQMEIQPAPQEDPPVQTAPQPVQPEVQNPPQQPAPLQLPAKKKVLVSSATIGKHRIRVNFVGVSDTAVFLGYIDDEDTNIFEPPLCSKDNPVTVRIEDQEFKCAYYGMSGEITFGPFDVFQVVLTRISE